MSSITDCVPHDLLPVAAMRCLATVEFLGRSISTNSALTFQKAAIFDAALKNPNIARKLLSALAPERASAVEFSCVLYPNEVEYGSATDTRDITKMAALLCDLELIHIQQCSGVLTLKPRSQQALIDVEALPTHWKSTLKALKPLLSKSAGALQQAVMTESKNYAEQHVFIARAPDSKRGYEEL